MGNHVSTPPGMLPVMFTRQDLITRSEAKKGVNPSGALHPSKSRSG